MAVPLDFDELVKKEKSILGGITIGGQPNMPTDMWGAIDKWGDRIIKIMQFAEKITRNLKNLNVPTSGASMTTIKENEIVKKMEEKLKGNKK